MKYLLVLFGLVASFSQIQCIGPVVERVLTKNEAVSKLCLTESSWTVLPDSRDCHKFYVCVNHAAEEFSCAANYYFDKTKLSCQLGVCPYAQAPIKCQQNAVQRVANNCNAFAVCHNGQLQSNVCAYGEYFSPRLARCQPVSISADHMCSCILPEHAVVSNADDCETYFACTNGKAVLQQCPRGQYYNERIGSCLPDLEGVCLVAPTMSPMELDMLQVCQQFGIDSAVLRAHPDDCAKFFLCVNGRIFTKRCPAGFYYDENMHYCRVDKERVCERKLQQKHQAELIETTGNIQQKPSPPKKLNQLVAPKPLQDNKNANKKNKVQPTVSQTPKEDKDEQFTKKFAALKENWLKKLKAQKLQVEKLTLLEQMPEKEASEPEQTKAAQKQQLMQQLAALNKKLKEKPKQQQAEPEKTTADKEQKLMQNFQVLKEKLEQVKEAQKQMPEGAESILPLVEKEQLGEHIKTAEENKQEQHAEKKEEEKQEELQTKQEATESDSKRKKPHKNVIYDKLSSKFLYVLL